MKRFCTSFFIMILVVALVGMSGSSICQAQDDYEENLSSNVEAQTVDETAMEYFEPEEESLEGELEYLPHTDTPVINTPASAFSGDGDGGFFYSFTEGYVSGADNGCVKAPVILPNGARIRYFYMTYYDNSTTENMTMCLRKSHYASGTTTTICSVSTSTLGNSSSVRKVQSNKPVNEIVSTDYGYTLTVCLSDWAIMLYSVRIYYTLPDETHLQKLILEDGRIQD